MMPLYDYYCDSCHTTSELLQKATDPVATTCPHCNEAGLKKKVSSAAFQLKGSGWYVTDFKNKPQEATKKSETATPKETPAAASEIKK